jgi:hypothetical protein
MVRQKCGLLMSLLRLFVNVPLAPQCHNASGSNLTSIVRPTREGMPSEGVADTPRGWLEQQDANASVWGGPGFKRSWRATSNGMEGAAALSNDSCLALDEISESDPRDIGAVVYALANGVGKQRAGRTGHQDQWSLGARLSYLAENKRLPSRWRAAVLGQRQAKTCGCSIFPLNANTVCGTIWASS